MAQILLIPGLICDRTVWEPLMARLGDEVEIADLSTQDSLTRMAEDCLATHDGKLRVAGHSMGARVAMEMARIAPERIERLALLDTGVHPLKEGEGKKREAAVRLAHEHGMQALAEDWLPGMVHEPNQQDERLMQVLTEMVVSQDPHMHERQINALVERPDASTYLARISCPVLLVVGREDAWAPVSQHEDMQRLLPDARLVVIEDAGHFAPLEKPDEVTGLLADFLG